MSTLQTRLPKFFLSFFFAVDILNNIRIRHLLMLIVSVLSLIAILTITWNASLVVDQYQKANQMANANTVVVHSMKLITALARERGLTSSLLANYNYYNEENKTRLTQLRQQTNQHLRSLYLELDSHPELPSLSAVYQYLHNISERLTNLRTEANNSFNQKEKKIDPHGWMLAISQNIEELRMISRILTAPMEEEDHASVYGVFIKEFFFRFSENAGKERALIGITIAQDRPFQKDEYQLLDNYQYINQSIKEQIDEVVDFFPQTAEILLAKSELERIYNEDYQTLRSSIIQSSLVGQSYPVTVSEWFDSATEAVDAIQNYSYAINRHIGEDIEIIKGRSHRTVIGLFVVLALIIVIFVMALAITFRRILVPLFKLESSAQTIAKGDFTRPLNFQTQDEFGDVAQAFEVMRAYLFHDRSIRQKAENELRKLSAILDQSLSSVVITDTKGIIEYVNPQFSKATGYPSQEVIGRKFNFLSSEFTPKSIYEDLWKTILSGKIWTGELINKKKNGDLYWELISISPANDRRGNNTHFISIQHDISERKTLEERIEFLAHHDELTGLPNRTLLADRFGQLVAHARRKNTKVALLVLGLDRFKQINDSIGHTGADQLLIQIAKRLKLACRDCDTLARCGSDEFVILVEDISNVELLVEFVKRLMDSFIEPVQVEDHDFHMSASIGISVWPNDGEDMGTLLRKSDTAMNHAKTNGKGHFQFFRQEMNESIRHRLRMENELHKAIDRQELTLCYQPQVDLKTGKIVGVEALVRWFHSELGNISPLQFIPLAEETNLIKPIGKWVLQTACEQLKYWENAGFNNLSMAVNVSVCQLEDDQFIPCLTEVLQTTGLAPASLEIEITESSVMSQPEKMLEVLSNIKKLGVRLALDDFGTGYSSLSYLRHFPFDKLKIDRTFIREITEKPEDVAIADAIAEMAHALKMTVLAEGVETELQADYMRICHCDVIQGYLISEPVPAGDCEKLFNQSWSSWL